MSKFKIKEIHYNDGYLIVENDNKKQSIYANGKLISNKWFDEVYDFHDGFARVKLGKNSWNYINSKGDFINRDYCFTGANNFYNGLAVVKNKGIYYNEGYYEKDRFAVIDVNCKYTAKVENLYSSNATTGISANLTTVLDFIDDFHEGLAIIKNNGLYNFARKDLQPISEEWFIEARRFHCGFAAVKNENEKWNFINTQGNKICNEEFDTVNDFTNGYAGVELNGKWNFIDKDGKFISDKWFTYVYDFCGGYAPVEFEDRSWNFIDTNGKIVNEKNIYGVTLWALRSDGYARVIKDNTLNLINIHGEYFSKEWYLRFGIFKNGIATIRNKYGFYNFINENGRIISNDWFFDAYDFDGEYALVVSSYIRSPDRRFNFIDRNGNYKFEHDFNILNLGSNDDLYAIELDDEHNYVCNYINKKDASLVFDTYADSFAYLEKLLIRKMKKIPISLEYNDNVNNVTYNDPIYREIAKILEAIDKKEISNDIKERIIKEVSNIKDEYDEEINKTSKNEKAAQLDIKNRYMARLGVLELEVLKKDKKAFRKKESKAIRQVINTTKNNENIRFNDPIYNYMASIVLLLDNEVVDNNLRYDITNKISNICDEYQVRLEGIKSNDGTILLSLDNEDKIKEDIIKKLSIIEYELNKKIKELSEEYLHQKETLEINKLIKNYSKNK